MRKPTLRIVSSSLLAVGAAVLATSAYAGKTLDTIKQRDQLVCGVNTGLPGFSAADSQGNWTGLDVDICRAIAASVLGDAKKVKWVPLNASQRFTALQSGEIDILSRNTTWTLTRDASLGLEFTGVTYYDGQGFMVPKKSKITSAKQLKGADGLRAIGHDDREEPDRLFQGRTTSRSSRSCSRRRRRPTRPTSPAAARPTRPTRRAWPRCATRKPATRTTT